MYSGFNLTHQSDSFSRYQTDGESIFSNQKKQVKSQLDSFLDGTGSLSASKMQENWFPLINAHVFISHSHSDRSKAVGLSGWLFKEFGLISFVDSCVWGYAGDLLKLIDDKYCLNSTKDTYSYQKRNHSTSHVHMMLTTALSKMMDQTECLIFLNTPSSLTPENVIDKNGTTLSPWIYSEIAMTRLIRRKLPKEHREIIRADGVKKIAMAMDESLKVRYDIKLDHLTELSTSELDTWKTNCQKKSTRGAVLLDELYSLKGI